MAALGGRWVGFPQFGKRERSVTPQRTASGPQGVEGPAYGKIGSLTISGGEIEALYHQDGECGP